MGKLENIHDNFLKSIFKKKENTRAFLLASLPKEVAKYLDFENIEIDDTGYISNEVRGYFSDIVVKTRIVRKGDKRGKVVASETSGEPAPIFGMSKE